jgi:hypothetical protein
MHLSRNGNKRSSIQSKNKGIVHENVILKYQERLNIILTNPRKLTHEKKFKVNSFDLFKTP